MTNITFYLALSVLAELKRLDGVSVPIPNDCGLDLPAPMRELLFGVKFPPDRFFQSAEPDAYPSQHLLHFSHLGADPDEIEWVAAHPQAIGVGESHGGNYQYFVLPEDSDLTNPVIYRVDTESDTDFAINVGRLSDFLRGLI